MTFVTLLLVKTTGAMTMGLFAVWLVRRRQAAVRHSILAATFGVVLTMPLVSMTLPEVRIAAMSATKGLRALKPAAAAVEYPLSTSIERSIDKSTAAQEAAWNLGDLLAGIWIVGVAVSLVPVVVGFWQIRSVSRFGIPWPRGQEIAQGIAGAAGIHRKVEVIVHEAFFGPAVCGVWNSPIVLPRDVELWTEEDLSRALMHEIEHVRRRDAAVGLLARLACAIYWFHPLMWIGWRKLLLEAERACDDAVLRDFPAAEYADQLIGLARRSCEIRRSAVFAMANRADLTTRVRAVLDQRQARGPAGRRFIALTCAEAAIFVGAIAPLILVAQSQARPKFEVASVKPIDRMKMSRDHEGHRQDREVFVDRTDTLSYIVAAYLPGSFCVMKVALGYDCPLISIGKSVPTWVRNERFEIQAKLPPNSQEYSERQKRAGDTPQVNLMLQVLLEERFQLKTHFETREIPVYAVTVGKDGHKLKPTPEGGSMRKTADGSLVEMHGMVAALRRADRGQIVFQSSSLQEAVAGLGNYFDRPLLDQTGLQGDFDFTLEYEPEPMQMERPMVDKTSGLGGNFTNPFSGLSAGALSVALQDVGLKLESTKARVQVLVIENIARPKEN